MTHAPAVSGNGFGGDWDGRGGGGGGGGGGGAAAAYCACVGPCLQGMCCHLSCTVNAPTWPPSRNSWPPPCLPAPVWSQPCTNARTSLQERCRQANGAAMCKLRVEQPNLFTWYWTDLILWTRGCSRGSYAMESPSAQPPSCFVARSPRPFSHSPPGFPPPPSSPWLPSYPNTCAGS